MRAGSTLRTTRRVIVAALAVALTATAPVGAHGTANGYQDSFATLGELPADRWKVVSGNWAVADQLAAVPLTGSQRALRQTDRTVPPDEPIVFLRDKVFSSFTAQVTAAFLDGGTGGTDPLPGSGLGIAFRAPVTEEEDFIDKDNMYVFGAEVAGVSATFPTGKGFVLYKRVGRGYYPLWNKIVATWADLTKPHVYKVVMSRGVIQAFVDGRLVIQHTDIPSGDQPTTADPLPGLPFASGAVGLRTSGARVWFDDFNVVGNDAYEGRAAALDLHAEYGNNSPNIRRGTSVQGATDLHSAGLNKADTGFQYHDHDYDAQAARPVDNPFGGQLPGISARASGRDGVSSSAIRMTGMTWNFTDSLERISVNLVAESIEVSATATCAGAASNVHVVNGVLTVTVHEGDRVPETVLGPYLIQQTYRPNTVLLENPPGGTAPPFSIVAHALRRTSSPARAEATALKIVIPGGTQKIASQGTGPVRTGEGSLDTAATEISLGHVVAGRYCS